MHGTSRRPEQAKPAYRNKVEMAVMHVACSHRHHLSISGGYYRTAGCVHITVEKQSEAHPWFDRVRTRTSVKWSNLAAEVVKFDFDCGFVVTTKIRSISEGIAQAREAIPRPTGPIDCKNSWSL
jgi:hypothetical protein